MHDHQALEKSDLSQRRWSELADEHWNLIIHSLIFFFFIFNWTSLERKPWSGPLPLSSSNDTGLQLEDVCIRRKGT